MAPAPLPFFREGPIRPTVRADSGTPTLRSGEAADLDFEWPVSAETLDACEIVLVKPQSPHLIVEPARVPSTTRVVEGPHVSDTKAQPWVRYASPALAPGKATSEDFMRWSAALAARQTAPAEPRRVGFAVIGGLCCALLAYVDFTMAPRGPVPTPPPVRASHTSDALPAALETDAPDRAGRVVPEPRAHLSRLNPRKGGGAPAVVPTVRRVVEMSPPKARVPAPVARLVAKVPAAPASLPPLALSSQVEPVPDAGSASPSLSSVSPTLPAPSSKAVDSDNIRSTLTRFRTAYSTLNAKAARAVWPTVDERALARAFSGLKSQAIAFDRCQTVVEGVRASAACEGRSTYVPRIGSSSARTDARQWKFALTKVDDQWTIDSASFR